jgi:hypothetical protein
MTTAPTDPFADFPDPWVPPGYVVATDKDLITYRSLPGGQRQQTVTVGPTRQFKHPYDALLRNGAGAVRDAHGNPVPLLDDDGTLYVDAGTYGFTPSTTAVSPVDFPTGLTIVGAHAYQTIFSGGFTCQTAIHIQRVGFRGNLSDSVNRAFFFLNGSGVYCGYPTSHNVWDGKIRTIILERCAFNSCIHGFFSPGVDTNSDPARKGQTWGEGLGWRVLLRQCDFGYVTDCGLNPSQFTHSIYQGGQIWIDLCHFYGDRPMIDGSGRKWWGVGARIKTRSSYVRVTRNYIQRTFAPWLDMEEFGVLDSRYNIYSGWYPSDADMNSDYYVHDNGRAMQMFTFGNNFGGDVLVNGTRNLLCDNPCASFNGDTFVYDRGWDNGNYAKNTAVLNDKLAGKISYTNCRHLFVADHVTSSAPFDPKLQVALYNDVNESLRNATAAETANFLPGVPLAKPAGQAWDHYPPVPPSAAEPDFPRPPAA